MKFLANDRNANGVVDAGEMTTLAQNNITQISLVKAGDYALISGNVIDKYSDFMAAANNNCVDSLFYRIKIA